MIVAVAGRRVDAPDSSIKRFPATRVKSVKQQLLQFLQSNHVTHLVCSAACGTDLLALQAAKELDIPFTIVLPFEATQFKSSSVVDRPGDWGSLYDELIGQVTGSPRLIELHYDVNDPDVYTTTNVDILDQAEELRSRYKESNTNDGDQIKNVVALIIWEGKPKDAEDATHHFMLEAQKRKFETREIRIISE